MKSFRNIPELLLPAGNLDKLNIAYLYGADAVYCGVPRYSLRARENEFSMEDLHTAVTIARNLKKKIYFTVNNIPRNSKLGSYHKYLEQMASLKPDALIMADPGLIHITKNAYPELEIHISVQTNTMNYAAVEFWKSYGAKRVILSREVSIPEIKEIKDKVPDMEIEVFVHGSICIAHSGRCFMSNYFKNRDANQGSCNNACRDLYKVYVTNPKQNDEPMELITDEDGTFLMNSKDLRAIEFLQ
ncbi:U32 family peptidase, partial [Leptospira levettii]